MKKIILIFVLFFTVCAVADDYTAAQTDMDSFNVDLTAAMTDTDYFWNISAGVTDTDSFEIDLTAAQTETDSFQVDGTPPVYTFNFDLLKSVNSIIASINSQMTLTARNKHEVIIAVNTKESQNLTSWSGLLAYLKSNYGN
jgi:hypothetical protein